MPTDPRGTGVNLPSVVVLSPYHNRRDAVERTLKSLAAQKYENAKFIVWDDGSSDGTWEELERVAHSIGDTRLHVIRFEKNLGLTQGLNWAISKFESDYVAIWGSGDESHPDRIVRQVEALEIDKMRVLCATASRSIDAVSGQTFIDESFSRRDIMLADIQETCPFTHGSVMYRRSALAAAGPYEEIFEWCADWDIFFRLLKFGAGIYLSEPLYTRYARLDGASFNPKKSLSQIRHQALAKLLSNAEGDRKGIIEAVRVNGLKSVLEERAIDITGPIYRRRIKLVLMGRREQARELSVLMAKDGLQSKVYFALEIASKAISRLPISSDRLINTARNARAHIRLRKR